MSHTENRTSTREEPGTARRVAETALDVAIGGTALAADKAVETVDRLLEGAEDAFREGRREAHGRAQSAKHTAEQTLGRSADARPYEERTRDELYALAAEREIAGRSNMRKAQLIAALRAER